MTGRDVPEVVHVGPLRFLGELAWDAVRALRVPERYGRWNLRRYDGCGR
ncbi:hypothetical protein J5X84_36400 [Streptosporangiaceae bacterium NEAU-GS5]|nr:hypothetical protein [Streptosporangiaceae bacterium NEAU-GS5]